MPSGVMKRARSIAIAARSVSGSSPLAANTLTPARRISVTRSLGISSGARQAGGAAVSIAVLRNSVARASNPRPCCSASSIRDSGTPRAAASANSALRGESPRPSKSSAMANLLVRSSVRRRASAIAVSPSCRFFIGTALSAPKGMIWLIKPSSVAVASN